MARVVALDSDVARRIAEAKRMEDLARAKGQATALMAATTAPTITAAANVKSTTSGAGRAVTVTGYTTSSAATPSSSVAGWNGVTLEKPGTSSKEQVRVYTNIEAPTDMSLLKVEMADSGATSFALDAAKFADAIPDELPLVPPSGTTTRTLGTSTTVGGTTRWEFSGTYKGVGGTFVCTASDCAQVSVTVSANGIDGDPVAPVYTFIDQWHFEPLAGATVKTADSDYMYFGSWLKTPNKQDGEYLYSVFYGGAVLSNSDTLRCNITWHSNICRSSFR